MRLLITAALMATASSAAAQPLVTQHQLDELRMQQEAIQRRGIDQSNQLQALEGRLRTEQAVSDLRSSVPRLPELRYEPSTRAAASTALSYPSVPDSLLADSNRRVQDAARNRR